MRIAVHWHSPDFEQSIIPFAVGYGWDEYGYKSFFICLFNMTIELVTSEGEQ